MIYLGGKVGGENHNQESEQMKKRERLTAGKILKGTADATKGRAKTEREGVTAETKEKPGGRERERELGESGDRERAETKERKPRKLWTGLESQGKKSERKVTGKEAVVDGWGFER